MKNPKMKKILIGLVALLLIVAVVVLIGRGCSGGKKESSAAGEEKRLPTTESIVKPPQQLPAAMTISGEVTAEGETASVAFPCDIVDYEVMLEALEAYSGEFVEDGSGREIKNIAAITLYNYGDFALEYMKLQLHCGKETLTFEAYYIPAGERVILQETGAKTMPKGAVESIDVVTIQGDIMDLCEDKLRFTEKNGDLTVMNLTKETMETICVYYKEYSEEKGMYVGGVSYVANISKLKAGETTTVDTEHYSSDSCRLVMVQICN